MVSLLPNKENSMCQTLFITYSVCSPIMNIACVSPYLLHGRFSFPHKFLFYLFIVPSCIEVDPEVTRSLRRNVEL